MTADRPPRLGALDLLRGITVAAMILVNNPGNWDSVFPQLTHAAWDGLTLADLVFPTFIFIMGVALSLSFSARPQQHGQAGRYVRIARRGILLVAMGLILNVANAWPDLATMRIPGVLQRIGLTYIGAAVVALNATDQQLWIVSIVLVIVHWVLLAVPVGHTLPGSLDPGTNIGAIIDRTLFGSHTLTATGDPEGALGLLTSIATALFGTAVGRWVVHATRRDAMSTVSSAPLRTPIARLSLAGAAAAGVGYAWSFVLPLNKALWTGSFAVLASGVAMLSLAACSVLLTRGAARQLSPFLWLGTNPLAVYFLSELAGGVVQRQLVHMAGHAAAPKDLVYWGVLVPLLHDGGGPWSSLVYAIGYALLWIGVAGVMRWRGIRLRV